MKIHQFLAFLFFLLLLSSGIAQQPVESTMVTAPVQVKPVISISDYSVFVDGGQLVLSSAAASGKAVFSFNGEDKEFLFQNGKAVLDLDIDERGTLALLHSKESGYRLYHFAKLQDGNFRVRHLPFWLSVLPPLVAIALALIFKEVVISLFIGVWAGAFIAGGLRIDFFYYFLESILNVVQRYVINVLADSGHLSVIVFSLLIGGMVVIISRNGGMAGVVQSLSKYARTPRSTQFITWLLGVAIFFDDYANTLIVGNTIRSVSDKFKISREKLAYILDSTAAPVSVLGDHCSPISDTTILSSLASDCNHIDHVRTQMPYAMTVGGVSCALLPGNLV